MTRYDPPTDQNCHLRKSAHPIAYTETMSNLYPDESISVDKCWERLHANTLYRLILTDGQHVDVLPVLYAVASQDDKQEIYIRTTRGNKFSSVVVSRRVAFEIDETLEDGIRSVIVVGIAHWLPPEMTPQIVRTFDLPDSETHEMQWVRIVPQTVYGTANTRCCPHTWTAPTPTLIPSPARNAGERVRCAPAPASMYPVHTPPLRYRMMYRVPCALMQAQHARSSSTRTVPARPVPSTARSPHETHRTHHINST